MGKPYRKDGTNAARQEAAHDWDQLRLEYFRMGKGRRSLRKLADAHGVNYLSLRSHSSREHWAQQARDHDAKVAKRAEALVVRDQAERMTRFLSTVDEYMDAFHEQLAKGQVALDGNTLIGMVKVAMVHMGEATERYEVVQVKELAITMTQIAMRRLPEEERDDFLSELRQRVGEIAARQ